MRISNAINPKRRVTKLLRCISRLVCDNADLVNKKKLRGNLHVSHVCTLCHVNALCFQRYRYLYPKGRVWPRYNVQRLHEIHLYLLLLLGRSPRLGPNKISAQRESNEEIGLDKSTDGWSNR